MFVKVALKNIKRSIKDYAIYFFTLVLGVAIFYVFNALDSQAIMLDVTERVRNMLELMNTILGVVSVFVSFILGALIIYASRFLIKRRSKEFGIYLTLGMGKRQISLILILETFFIGLLSLGVGLVLGILASQLTSVLVANMFDANLTQFQFVFSGSAFVKTLIYFGVIYLVVMIFNTINISRQKLINLLSSSRRNEKIKLKNLWLCTGVFIIASTMLGIAYYLVTAGLVKFMEDGNGEMGRLLIPIIMGVIATFLLFWSLSGLLLRVFMSFKNVYYKKLNSFVLRQFSSKINTTVSSMSVICLMLFVTVCILGSALSINKTMHAAMEQTLPFDVQVESYGEHAVDIKDAYAKDGTDLDELVKDIITYRIGNFETLALNDSLDETSAVLDENGAVQSTYVSERFVTLSDYNKVAPFFQLPTIELNDQEYAVLANYRQSVKLRNAALAKHTPIEIEGKTLYPKFEECIDGTIELEVSKTNGGIIIIPDSLDVNNLSAYYREIMLANYLDESRSVEIEDRLMSLRQRYFNSDPDKETVDDSTIFYYGVTPRQSIIDNSVGTSALVTFIGLYLGIIFLISSAAVLALKELSESSDNRQKYAILRQIGTDEHTLNSALFWQIFIFFLFPLLIAAIHSVFGLMFCDFVLSSIGGIDITQALPGVIAILAIVYGGYFLITYACSRNIIRDQRS